jgi:cytidylate kinase
MEHRVVCISRTIGADAEEVARLVAERLSFRLIDEEILLQAADKAGVNAGEVADVEQRKSFLGRVVNDMLESGTLTAYGPVVPPATGPKRDELRGFIRQAIEESTDDGAAVIVAHGASIALTDRDDVLRVLITASPETRSGRLVAAEQAKESEAAKLVAESDAARVDYLKRFYNVGAELPTTYDLVLNTDRLTAEDAAGVVVQAVKG